MSVILLYNIISTLYIHIYRYPLKNGRNIPPQLPRWRILRLLTVPLLQINSYWTLQFIRDTSSISPITSVATLLLIVHSGEGYCCVGLVVLPLKAVKLSGVSLCVDVCGWSVSNISLKTQQHPILSRHRTQHQGHAASLRKQVQNGSNHRPSRNLRKNSTNNRVDSS